MAPTLTTVWHQQHTGGGRPHPNLFLSAALLSALILKVKLHVLFRTTTLQCAGSQSLGLDPLGGSFTGVT